jgi:hypothetical protein
MCSRPLPLFLVVAGKLWCLALTSAFISTFLCDVLKSKFPHFYKDTSLMGWGPTLWWSWLILTNYICNDCHILRLWFKTSTCLLKGHELALNSHPPSHTVQTPECRYDRPKGETGLQPVERTFLITIATSFFFFIPTTSERKIKLATSRSSVLKHFGLRTLYTYQKAKRKKKNKFNKFNWLL